MAEGLKKLAKFTPEERGELLRRYTNGEPSSKIAASIGVPQYRIDNMVRYAGVKGVKRCEKRLDILPDAVAMYESGKTISEVAKAFNVNRGVMGRMLAKKTDIRKQPTTCNEASFDEINEDSAYWAGFLMADGYVTDAESEGHQRYVGMGLQRRDEGHIRKFLDWLCCDAKINHTTNPGYTWDGRSPGEFAQSSARVRSTRIASRLCEFGVVPRKTHIAKAADFIATNRHFWRGCVDGDGCIMVRVKGKDKPSIYLCGNRELVDQWTAFCKSVIPDCTVTMQKQVNIWVGIVGGRQAIDLARILYADCTIALDRKQDRALELLSMNYGAKQDALYKNVHAPDGEAWCGKCRQYKPVAEFGKSRNRAHGLNVRCKACCKEAYEAYKPKRKRKTQLQ